MNKVAHALAAESLLSHIGAEFGIVFMPLQTSEPEDNARIAALAGDLAPRVSLLAMGGL